MKDTKEKAVKTPKIPKSVTIDEAENGYTVSCYNGERSIKTVHESMEGALESVKKMMAKKTKKSDMSPELEAYMG